MGVCLGYGYEPVDCCVYLFKTDIEISENNNR